MKNINEKLLYAIVSVTVNQSMPEEFSLKSELNAAIDILHSAARASMSVADLISQGSMFAETQVKADYESLAVAIFLSKSKAQFKKIMSIYNTAAKAVQGGSLFGEVDNRDKRQILKDTIEWMQSEKLLTDADKYALQRYEKLEAKPKNVIDMLPSTRKKLTAGETDFLTKQVKKETEKQAKPTPSVSKAQTLINDLKEALKYIKDKTKIEKYTALVADLELAAKYAKPVSSNIIIPKGVGDELLNGMVNYMRKTGKKKVKLVDMLNDK